MHGLEAEAPHWNNRRRKYNTSMSKPAVSAYIRTLREARNLSRPELTLQTGISTRTIENFENAYSDIRFSTICLLLNAVRGMPQHVYQLSLDAAATEQDGRDLAQALFQSEATTVQIPIAPIRGSDERTRAVMTYVYTLRERIGISTYRLSDSLVELFKLFRDWEITPHPDQQAVIDRLAMYVWTLCEDMLHLLSTPAIRSEQGQYLAMQRSSLLNQVRYGQDAKASYLVHTSQLAIIQQRLQALEMMLPTYPFHH